MGTAVKSDSERLAEVSGVSVEEVEKRLADGLLFYKEDEWSDGEWRHSGGTQYVVAGHGYFGKGADEAEAKANFRRYGGRLKDGYVVLTFAPGSIFLGISAMGWQYLGEPPAVREVPAK